MFRLFPALAVIALAVVIGGIRPPVTEAADDKPTPTITWKKTILDRKFRSEGVAVADVNKDGKIDVLNGEYWYEAPDWTPHELQPPKDFGDGQSGYSRVFFCWAED